MSEGREKDPSAAARRFLLWGIVTLVSSPYKSIDEKKIKAVGVREIKNIQQQLNYSNKVLTTLSKSIEELKPTTQHVASTSYRLERIGIPKIDPHTPIIQPSPYDLSLARSGDVDELLEEINKKLDKLKISSNATSRGNVNMLHMDNKEEFLAAIKKRLDKLSSANAESSKGSSRNLNMLKNTTPSASSNILPLFYETKNYYKRPSAPDQGYDDSWPTTRTFDGGSIHSWNIDGCSEGQMLVIFQEMFPVASAYVGKHMTPENVVKALIAGFTGNLRSWWYNHLTEIERQQVTSATKEVKRERDAGNGLVENYMETVPNPINSLLYTAMRHFVGRTSLWSDQFNI